MSRIYEWKSDMKDLLQTFIREKQMTNFKYKVQARKLERFDAYYYYDGYSGIRLTKPMLDGFIYGEFEKSSTHYKKEILMRDFAEFLDRHGYPVHVPLVKSAQRRGILISLTSLRKSSYTSSLWQWILILWKKPTTVMYLIRCCSGFYTEAAYEYQKP